MEPELADNDLVGRVVYAATGQRLGRVDTVYRDGDKALVFAAVRTTRRGRRRLMYVPLDGATIQDTAVRLRCGAALARQAPRTGRRRGLPSEFEAELYHHYDLPYRKCEDDTAGLWPAHSGRHRR